MLYKIFKVFNTPNSINLLNIAESSVRYPSPQYHTFYWNVRHTKKLENLTQIQ